MKKYNKKGDIKMAENSEARMIEIPLAEYVELIKLQARVETLKTFAEKDIYVSNNDIATILNLK